MTGYGDPALVALATGASHLSSQLMLLPFFLRPLSERPTARRAEQVLSWIAVLTVTVVVFRVDGLPVLGFLVMPLLVWGALRLGTWHALGQVVVVALVGDVFYTLGYGPISWVPAGLGDRADVAALLLQLFDIGCVLVVMPLTVLVSLSRGSDREAATERDKLASVVDAARGVAIIGADPHGRVTLFNRGAERLLGYRSEEVIGGEGTMFHSETSIRVKAAELDVAPDYQSVARRMLEPDQAGALLSFRRSDGAERVHRVTISEIVDDRGRVSGYLSTSEDVTDQVSAQEAVERSLQRMQEVDVLKDTLVSTVSHELRTPVTSIVGYLEMLEDDEFGALTENQRGAVARVRSSSSRLLVLIDDLLTLARMQDTSSGTAGAAVPLADIVVSGCAVVAPQAAAGSVDLRVDSAVRDPRVLGAVVRGDRDALEGVVINLVGNAVKFTPEGGTVEVGLTVEDQEVLLVVRDTGIGIPAEEIEHLFTRFFRSSISLERQIPGSGLGLAIANAVVHRLGGRISVDSEVGVGSRFSVRLPRTPDGA